MICQDCGRTDDAGAVIVCENIMFFRKSGEEISVLGIYITVWLAIFHMYFSRLHDSLSRLHNHNGFHGPISSWGADQVVIS